MKLPINEILHGDCLEVLKTIPDESVTSCVCDPPYGLGQRDSSPEELLAYLNGAELKTGDFMNKPWDLPPVAVWKECFRVLKPGGHLLAFAGCYDEETEVLTKCGWVPFPSITGDEEFASLDLSTHQVEWQKAKEVVRQVNTGGMVRYKTNKIDLLVTPNHNMLVATLGSKNTPFSLKRADSHGRAVRMTKTSTGRKDMSSVEFFELPSVMQSTSHGHEVEVPAKSIPLSAWLPFFGLWLAEGSASTVETKLTKTTGKMGYSYNVAIAHFTVENLNEIKDLLSEWFDVKVYPKLGKLRINSKQLVLYLDQFGYSWEKYIPEFIKTLPSHHLRTLWDWYMRGDGHDHRVGYTSSLRLRDDWQELSMYMGISADWVTRKPKLVPNKIKGREIHARRPQYAVTFNYKQSSPEVYDRRRSTSVRTIVTPEEWNGRMVYCVELDIHHTLYVRRNGKSVWCGNTRTQDLMSMGIRMAGFENRDTIATMFGPQNTTISWLYGSGFPKSRNISLDIDRQAGATRKVIGTKKGVGGENLNDIVNGRDIRLTTDEGGKGVGAYGTGAKQVSIDIPVTEAATEEAKRWSGYGTNLKPSQEPVLVFRKPISEKTLAEQIIKTGTGAINIDGCRVGGTGDHIRPGLQGRDSKLEGDERTGVAAGMFAPGKSFVPTNHQGGRWPANTLLVHGSECQVVGTKKVKAPIINRFDDGMKPFGDGAGHGFTSTQTGDENGEEEVPVYECMDGCPVKALDKQSGESASKVGKPRGSSKSGEGWGMTKTGAEYSDNGGASRFFAQFEPDAPFFYCGKAPVAEKKIDKDLEQHPTVKPLKLMSYLVRLVTPKGGVVLDPYSGSGTTCVAAVLEGANFIGIEKHEPYVERARIRIEMAKAGDFNKGKPKSKAKQDKSKKEKKKPSTPPETVPESAEIANDLLAMALSSDSED